MKLFFKTNIKYKACKYFVRKSTGSSNLFGKISEQYVKTNKINKTKEDILNEKKLDV